ncbi:GAF and ANTAR domain-containing protein [Streptomyces sp. NPDC048442]|uniref:GAF and ANTAR domain-containing protein n=1 Tax=Streptomyces sp. NPDC048442 TaxID=3154823 RepID=UPI00343536DC
MVSTRMAALLDELAVRRTAGLDESFARHCSEALGVDGLAVTLSRGTPTQQSGEPVWFSGSASVALEDLQFTLGEGPGTDALRTGRLVLEGDLGLVSRERWPGFLPAAEMLGVRAVFSVPLQIGAILVGVLTCHRADPAPLDQESLANLLVFADALTLTLLGSTESAGPGTGSWLAADASLYRAEVHQATGMISVRLGVPPAAALVRLRAYAYAAEAPILEVARDVVARRLRFTSDGALRDGDGSESTR